MPPIEAGGERFRFDYDQDEEEALHITLKHGTTPEDAILTFFDGAKRGWDEARSRFETATDEHVLFLDTSFHDASVMVISCFRREVD